MDAKRLLAIARRWGTPCFVFDEQALDMRMRTIRQIVDERIRLCYSVKANPFLIPAMLSHTALLEVCSPGELLICEDLGVPPERVLFSGVNKTAADVAHAMDAGVSRFTAESPLHVRLLSEAARERKRVVSVLLRLTCGTQFGMDERDLRAILRDHDAYANLRFEGLHYFVGTQRKKPDEQRAELAMLIGLLQDLRAAYGLPLRELEYGPGLPFPYFIHEDDHDTLFPLRELADALRKMADHAQLTVEMGRFFVSDCGTYLTRVMDTKVNHGYAYAIVDGGIHHVNYIGGNMGMRVPHILHLRGDGMAGKAATALEWTLCGSLCTTADVLVRKIAFDRLSPGDTLAFLRIGAYAVTEGPNLFLSRDMPRVLLADEHGERLARDFTPTHLLNTPTITQKERLQ